MPTVTIDNIPTLSLFDLLSNNTRPTIYKASETDALVADTIHSMKHEIENIKKQLAANTNPVKIALINDCAKLPTTATDGSAGYDVYAATAQPVCIGPGETIMIPLGFKTEFPKEYVGLIFARSGLSVKKGLAPANKVGVIDSDYRGEWKVALHNHSAVYHTIEAGDRIAQICFMNVLKPSFELVNESDLCDTDRGEGGFNSTGTK